MGFPADTDFAAVVAAYIEDHPHAVKMATHGAGV